MIPSPLGAERGNLHVAMRCARPARLLLPLLVVAVVPCRAQELPEPGESEADLSGVGPVESSTIAAVDSAQEPEEEGEYHTPLAGRPYRATVFGRDVEIEPRDRGTTFALNVGGAYFNIQKGDTSATPIFAGYGKFYFAQRRFRLVTSVFVNSFDYAEDFGGPESLFHFENFTIPFGTEEVIDGRSREETRLVWGDVNAWLGAGYRWRISPGEVDNDVRLGAYYTIGYEYHDRTDDTPPTERVATDTFRHGIRLVLRVDAIMRNLLELPHYGFACGADYELTRRDRWRDHGEPTVRIVDGDETRDYQKVSAYAVLAFGVPFLSERHRLVAQVHAGYSKHDTVDRYSAFRLGGGPIPTESADLARAPFPGAGFNQYPVEDYLYVTLEYRFEVMFFLYLHLRGTVGIAKAPTLDTGRTVDRLRFQRREGYALTVAITSGFVWESQVYVEYDYDITGGLRGGIGGSTVLVLWSKSF